MTLKPLKDARTKWNMDRIVTFDIESTEWTKPVALGMYYENGNQYEVFKEPNVIEEFVDEMLRRRWRNHYFVAHYGGRYDFIPVIERLIDIKDERDLEIEIITKGSNNTPFFVKIKDGNDKPRYLQDSSALMPRSLKSLSESFTEDTVKLDFDVKKILHLEQMEQQDIDEMLRYLKRDCVSLYKVLDTFTDMVLRISGGKCPCQITVGSTAMGVYRTKFMPDIYIEDCYNPEAEVNPEEKVRNSYFGGRTEVYKMYGKDLNHYDVNSLYPYCYTRKPVPIGKVSHTGRNFPLGETDYGGVLKIEGRVPEGCCNNIPVLPYRVSSDQFNQERVVFPTGKISGWYTAKEVRYAREVGALTDLEIKDSYCSRYGYPFESYGETLYEEKKQIDKHKNPGLYKVVKFLLNSFYGKFGMERQHDSVVMGDVTKSFMEGKKAIDDRLTNKGIMLEESESKAGYILPRIASSITAQARIEMHKWFMKVFDLGGDIWYCDTDSIVTDVELPEGDDLGEMDFERRIDEGVFLAPKVYAEKHENGTLVKAKGMKDIDATFDRFRQAYEDDEPSLINSSWETVEGFKSGLKNDSGMFNTSEQSRSLRQFDQKRKHSNNQSVPVSL